MFKTKLVAVALILFAGVVSGVESNGIDPVAVPATSVTFNKDIAPIVFKNCTGCHRPGEVAPFALLTYQDTFKHAK